MAKRKTFNLESLLRDGSETFRRFNANVKDQLARAEDTEQKRDGFASLVKEGKDPEGMVDIPSPLHVRIIRNVPDRRHFQDDDNQSGGAKQLRDAIASFLCRKGDSEEDGLTWEYITKIGPFSVEIEVHERKEQIDVQ